MARPLACRIVVEGALEAVTPLQVGGAGDGDVVDISLTRDGLGRFYVPGTGLAGAMRAWCERRFGRQPTRSAWGYQEKEEGHASHIDVDDAVASIPTGEPEVWPGVGIDRFTGTAAPEVLYSREILPRGTTLPLRLTLELEDANENEPSAMLHHLLGAMHQGIYLGGGKTRGTGKVRLRTGVVIREQDWSRKDGVLAALRRGGDRVKLTDLPDNPKPDRLDIHHLEIAWEAKDPVMVAAGYSGLAVDILPLVSAVSDDEVALVLPGSAIKGALRATAERIMRTLLDLDVDGSEKFLDQVSVPLVNDLFGEALTSRTGRAGAVAVDTCYSTGRIRRSTWEAITRSRDDKELRCHLDTTGLDIDHAYHLKIDRWTGDAFGTALFSTLEPRVSWEPIRLLFDRERLHPDVRVPATVLLALAHQEFVDGRVPLGFGVNRGYGGVSVTEATGTPWEEDLAPMADTWSEYLHSLCQPAEAAS